MNDEITSLIKNYVMNYKKLKATESAWREPIIGFASADDPLFLKLKDVVSLSHSLPADLINDAKSVIVFFVPFVAEIVKSNIKGVQSSREWDYAKIETNNLLNDINEYLYEKISAMGYTSTLLPPTYNYDEEKFISDWSHRHVGYVAGIGTFGINNMFITDSGCCGRMGSIVTDLPLEPTERKEQENCLYKYNASCTKCVDKCVVNAISIENNAYLVDKKKCSGHIDANTPQYPMGVGDACGKCKCGVPCSVLNPVKQLNGRV